jgi:hypothetical protein
VNCAFASRDLSGAHLAGGRLLGVFHLCTCETMRVSGGEWSFAGGRMRAADLTGATLHRARPTECDLRGGDRGAIVSYERARVIAMARGPDVRAEWGRSPSLRVDATHRLHEDEHDAHREQRVEQPVVVAEREPADGPRDDDHHTERTEDADVPSHGPSGEGDASTVRPIVRARKRAAARQALVAAPSARHRAGVTPLWRHPMSGPQHPPPRRAWPAFAVVGFVAGVVTVILVVSYLP